MSCTPACIGEIRPMALANCSVKTKPGGIKFHGVVKCDFDFDAVSGSGIEDIAVWTVGIESGDIIVSGEVIGSKAKGSDTALRVASCRPEQTVGSIKTISIRDYNSDETAASEYDFYNDIQENHTSYRFFYVTCDDKLYYYDDGTWTPQTDDVREETKEGVTFIDFVVNVSELGIKKPYIIEGISALVGASSVS